MNILTYDNFYNGGGVAIGDINNDGLSDIFFSSNNGQNKLYLNKGNLYFEDITNKALGDTVNSDWCTGVSFTDINNDGYLDISLCGAGNHKNKNTLYVNNKNLSFSELSDSFNLTESSMTTQSYFLDIDLDGDLDAFLLNIPRPNVYKPSPLRHNYGDSF